MARKKRTQQGAGKVKQRSEFPLIYIGAAVALAIIVLGGLIFFTGRQPQAQLGSNAALAEGTTKGSADAKVTMIEFSDFQ